MRQQETKVKRKIERYRREGGEQKSQDRNTAGRKGHAQCGVKPQPQGRRSGERGYGWHRQHEKDSIGEKTQERESTSKGR